MHLQVSDLGAAESFYHGVLGFDVIVRAYPGALFVSAGGYHHHIGLNTWHSANAAPAPARSVGLRSFTVELPDDARARRGSSPGVGRRRGHGRLSSPRWHDSCVTAFDNCVPLRAAGRRR